MSLSHSSLALSVVLQNPTKPPDTIHSCSPRCSSSCASLALCPKNPSAPTTTARTLYMVLVVHSKIVERFSRHRRAVSSLDVVRALPSPHHHFILFRYLPRCCCSSFANGAVKSSSSRIYSQVVVLLLLLLSYFNFLVYHSPATEERIDDGARVVARKGLNLL